MRAVVPRYHDRVEKPGDVGTHMERERGARHATSQLVRNTTTLARIVATGSEMTDMVEKIEISISINVNTLEPYITNVVRDHKTVRLAPPLHGHLVVKDLLRLDFGDTEHESVGDAAGAVPSCGSSHRPCGERDHDAAVHGCEKKGYVAFVVMCASELFGTS